MRHKSVLPVRRSAVAIPERVREARVAPRNALHIKIGRLTIQGYSSAEQRRFSRALESSLRELGQRGGGQWFATKTLRINRVDAGRLSAGTTPEAAARQIATRLFASLTQAQATGRTTCPGEKNHA